MRFYVNGFGGSDPDAANEAGGVLSAADMAALAALTPEEPPEKGIVLLVR